MMKNEKLTKYIYPAMIFILLLCGVAVMSFLSFYACRYSYYATMLRYGRDQLVKDVMWRQVLGFVAATVLVFIVDRLFQKLKTETVERICFFVLAAVSMAAFVVGMIYVMSNPYYPDGDQLNATAFAAYCRGGNFIMLSPGGYVGLYQQQKGIGFLYEILFTVFGDYNYTAAKIFHVVWWVLAIIAGYGFLKLNTKRAVCRPVYCIFMLGCLPFLLYLPYIYGDILSISFSMILFWAVSAYEHFEKKRYVVLAAGVAAVALLARKNTWIVLIGVAIYFVMVCVRKKKLRYLLAGAVILMTAALSVKMIDKVYEYRSGYPSGIGIPSVLWVAMGLQETDGMAGVYNRYQQTVFEETGFVQEVAARQGVEYIRGRMKEFSENPRMAWDFMKRKLEGQWTEPLFESLRSTQAFPEEAQLLPGIQSLYYGSLHDIVWKIANRYQSIVYLAGLAYVVTAFIMGRKRYEAPAAVWLPMIVIVGGFLFSILWEAKPRYVLPYYVFLILYVPEGMYRLADAAAALVGRGRGRGKKDSAERTKLRKTA